jgi:hypothetical protein
MDENEEQTLARRLDEAANGALDAVTVNQRLGVTADDGDAVKAVAFALLYYERSEETGVDHFAPLYETDQGSFPPPVDQIAYDAVKTWSALAESVSDPLVKSRLHDLCFVRRSGNGRDHAREAAEAYLALADRYPSSSEADGDRARVAMNATHYVARALELARQTGQDELAERVIVTGLRLAETALDNGDGPGVILGFLRPLVNDRACPPEVDVLLERAREAYAGDVWNTRSTIAVQLERQGMDASTQERLKRETVEAMLKFADGETPVNALFHLRDAAELARRYDLDDLYRTAVEGMQRLRGVDLGLTPQGITAELPREDVDRWINHLVGQETWSAAVIQLVATMPATGELEANRALAEEIARETPLQNMLMRTQLGRDGLPVAMSDGGEPENRLANLELKKMGLQGPVYAMVLRAILERWETIGEDEAVTFFVSRSHVPESVARAIGRAIVRHRSGDYEGAVYTLLPRIERLARELLLLLGEPVYTPPMFGKRGTYLTLGAMMAPLEARGLDPSWIRYFKVLLLGDGYNLRNDALHGNLDHVSETDSALVLIAAIYLASLEPR